MINHVFPTFNLWLIANKKLYYIVAMYHIFGGELNVLHIILTQLMINQYMIHNIVIHKQYCQVS